MKQGLDSAKAHKTQENQPSDMAPGAKPRKSGGSSEIIPVRDDMGAKALVRRVPWHPSQAFDYVRIKPRSTRAYGALQYGHGRASFLAQRVPRCVASSRK